MLTSVLVLSLELPLWLSCGSAHFETLNIFLTQWCQDLLSQDLPSDPSTSHLWPFSFLVSISGVFHSRICRESWWIFIQCPLGWCSNPHQWAPVYSVTIPNLNMLPDTKIFTGAPLHNRFFFPFYGDVRNKNSDIFPSRSHPKKNPNNYSWIISWYPSSK